MKVVMIPPYSNIHVVQSAWEHELVSRMNERGQLVGVEVDIAMGYPTDFCAEARDAVFTAIISPGVIKRVQEYSHTGEHDAIIVLGALEPAFYAAQMVSKIPVIYALHAAVYIASFLGERFSIIDITDDSCHVVRRCIRNHGLDHKLVSVRAMGHSSTHAFRVSQKYKKAERANSPEGQQVIDAIITQCIAAIEKDMADTLVWECPAVQIFEDEVRQKLDELGYQEIQTISSFPAAISMARTMFDMKLTPAPRAFPSDTLRSKPEYR